MSGYYARPPRGTTATKPRSRGGYRGNPNGPMTDAQRELLRTLLAERQVPDGLHSAVSAQVETGMKNMTASAFITALLALDKIPREDEPTQEGFYRHVDEDGNTEVYKVCRAKAGHMYPLMRNSEGKWKVLAKGVFNKLSATELLTEEEAVRGGLMRS